MKLCIVTQVVDKQDPVLGFFHRWIEEFAKHCEQVTVICLKEGNRTLPENVCVLSLGKEKAGSSDASPYTLEPRTHNLFLRLRYVARFYRYIWKLRHQYDAVFVHMNPEYVVLGAPLWRVLGKKVSLWYTHKSVTTWLHVAVYLAHTIFTASKESFRIPSSKVHVVGHGIDVDTFRIPSTYNLEPRTSTQDALRLVSVGRISHTKRQDLAIEALALIREQGIDATLTLIGTPLTDGDRVYEAELRTLIAKRSLDVCVVWAGAVANADLPARLAQSDILVHTSETGSLDKVVLEALAAGLLLVTTSPAIRDALPEQLQLRSFVDTATPEALATGVASLLASSDQEGLRTAGRAYVVSQHALPVLVTKLTAFLG